MLAYGLGQSACNADIFYIHFINISEKLDFAFYRINFFLSLCFSCVVVWYPSLYYSTTGIFIHTKDRDLLLTYYAPLLKALYFLIFILLLTYYKTVLHRRTNMYYNGSEVNMRRWLIVVFLGSITSLHYWPHQMA